MISGVIHEIREFTTHDGPGVRTTVFLKGCVLRCVWCHNPEGLSGERQAMRTARGERTVGRRYTAEEVAAILNRQAAILRSNGGGVTFSGGEPLLQAPFVEDIIDRLSNVHVVLDTAGYATESAFRRVAGKSHLVYFDLKLVDRETHIRYTGVDNAPILANLRVLSSMNVPYVMRVPLVPGVTDTDANLRAIAGIARSLPGLVRVDLLPYNRAAGGKYAGLGMEFRPSWNEAQPVNANVEPFLAAAVPVSVAGASPPR
ncbi:MAG: radical SAM protein [Bryobacteraceae bacterium]